VVEGGRAVKVRLDRTPLPRCFQGHPEGKGIVAECDIGMRNRRLYAKFLLFKNKASLRRFWARALAKDQLGKDCLGAVNGLAEEILVYEKGKQVDRYLRVDPRYFCVIGMVQGHTSMEIICHGAAHAGFAYAKRRRGDHWVDATELDEEKVCYPTGMIAAGINRFLHDNGLYR
jgi:hypothetical protein